MNDTLERAKGFYKLAAENPIEACNEYLSTDFVLENYLPAHIPFGGRYKGAEGFLTYLGEMAQAIEMGPLQMDSWVCDGHSVVVRGREESLVRATARTYRMQFVHWLEFDDAVASAACVNSTTPRQWPAPSKENT
jgi:ketosteroid isomerase-like protein